MNEPTATVAAPVTAPAPTTTAPLTATVADAIPPAQAAALAALRTRLGLDPVKESGSPLVDATATPPSTGGNVVPPTAAAEGASPVAGSTVAPTEETVLRALAEEQLRLARERRQLQTDRKDSDTSRAAMVERLKRLDAIEAAQKDGNRIALLRALHNGELPDGELGQWGSEIGAAMSGDIAITPEDLDKIVDRKLAAKEAAAQKARDEAETVRAATRNEANQNYLTVVDSALRADPSKFPGLNRFGVKADRVLALVAESFQASGGKEVISIADVLDKLESDIRSDIAATPYGQKPAISPAHPSATQPSVSATLTSPAAADPGPLSVDQIEARARAEIIKRARELMGSAR